MADNKKPEPKKKFISDQDMWEMSLDMVGDDSIDPTHRTPDDRQDKQSKVVHQSKAKTASLNKNTGGAGNPPTNPLARPAASSARQQNDNGQQRRVPQQRVPQQKPVQQKVQRDNPVPPRSTPNRPVARQQLPLSRPSNSQSGRARPTQSNRPAAPGTQKPVSGNSATGQRTRASAQQANSASVKQTPAFKGEQTQPAVFTTRDVSHRVGPQNLESYNKKKRKEKFIRVATSLWAIFDFLWIGVVKLTKWTVKSLPFVWRHKALVSVGIVCFTVGFITGAYFPNSHVREKPVVNKSAVTTNSIDTHKKKKQTASAKTSKPKPAKSTVVPARKVQTQTTQAPAMAETGRQYLEESTGMNQFSGRDILIEEVDNSTEPTIQATDSMVEAAPEQQDMNSTISQALDNDTVTARVEPEAATNAMFEKKIQQIDNDKSNKPQQEPVVLNDEAKALLEQNIEAFQNKDWQLVIDISDKIIAIDPRIIGAYINRSVAHTELGMIDEAISDSNKAILLNPRNPLPINNRGYAYEKAGAIDNAIADYQAACNLGIKLSCEETERLRRSIAPGE